MVKDNKTGKCHCSKSYPKAFSSDTLLDDDSYPTYRRREGGFAWKKKIGGIDYTFSNRDVVPYNPTCLNALHAISMSKYAHPSQRSSISTNKSTREVVELCQAFANTMVAILSKINHPKTKQDQSKRRTKYGIMRTHDTSVQPKVGKL